jgi:hypothetical protein
MLLYVHAVLRLFPLEALSSVSTECSVATFSKMCFPQLRAFESHCTVKTEGVCSAIHQKALGSRPTHFRYEVGVIAASVSSSCTMKLCVRCIMSPTSVATVMVVRSAQVYRPRTATCTDVNLHRCVALHNGYAHGSHLVTNTVLFHM